jgi:putative transposase
LLPRASYYYESCDISEYNLQLMHLIDKEYTKHPFYGYRRLTAWLRRNGYEVNSKRVRRLMRVMGIEAIYQKPNLSKPAPNHKIYPYLLRGVKIERPDHVWSTDITYIRMERGFIYLAAIIYWYSRYALSYEISTTLDNWFCIEALNSALNISKPKIFNSDQGSQFTSNDFTNCLKKSEITISMDGRGRAYDNIFIERFWRSVKYEEVYIQDYKTIKEAIDGLDNYFDFYNNERPHQSLNYKTPAEVYYAGR